jgi:hypothetical protein
MGDFMVWGISGVDVSNNGWNLAVGCGVAAGCGIAAYAVAKLGEVAFAPATDANKEQRESAYKKMDYARYAGVAVGLGAAYYLAFNFVPASRFALVTDDSNSKALKLGAVQTAIGFAINYFTESNSGAVAGLGGALATRFGNVVLLGFGAFGTAVATGFISK